MVFSYIINMILNRKITLHSHEARNPSGEEKRSGTPDHVRVFPVQVQIAIDFEQRGIYPNFRVDDAYILGGNL